MKKRVLNLTFVFVILLITLVITQTTTPEPELTDEQKLAMQYGQNPEKLDELVTLGHAYQNTIFSDKKNIDAFFQGLEESQDYDKFYDLWSGKKEDGELKLGDDAKKKLWKYIIANRDTNKDLKETATKLYNKLYSGIEWSDGIKRGIDSINIKNPEKLTWKGNKLGIWNEKEGRFDAVVDFERLPNWIKGIEFDGTKFNYVVDTGKGNWNLPFEKGGFDPLLRRIGLDGKVIGIHMNEGITSVKYNKGAFEIGYNFDGTEKTVKMNENELNPWIAKKLKSIFKGEGGDALSGALGDVQANLAIDFLSEDIRNKRAFPTENMLSFAIKNPEGSTIYSTFDENGNLIVKPEGGARFATMDSKLNVKKLYSQFKENKEGIYLFDKQGNILEAENYIVEATGFATAYGEEKTKFRITQNTLADAIARGDKKTALEYMLYGDPKMMEKVFSGDITKLDHIADILQTELARSDLSIEAKGNLQDIRQQLSTRIQDYTDKIIDSMFSSSADEMTPDQQSLKETVSKIAEKNINDRISSFLSDPENFQKLLGNDPEQVNAVLRGMIIDTVSSDDISTILAELEGKIPSGARTNPDQSLVGIIGETVNGINLYEHIFSDKDWDETRKEALVQEIVSSLPLTEKVKKDEDIEGSLRTLFSKAEEKIRREKANAALEIPQEYTGNQIIMDLNSKKVLVQGKGMAIDLASPLTEVSVNNQRTAQDSKDAVTTLFYNGKPIAVFDGEKTNLKRDLRNEPDLLHASIDLIINENNPNRAWKLNDGTMNDPQRLVETQLYKKGQAFSKVDGVQRTIQKGGLKGLFAWLGDPWIGESSPNRNVGVWVNFNVADIDITMPESGEINAGDKARILITSNPQYESHSAGKLDVYGNMVEDVSGQTSGSEIASEFFNKLRSEENRYGITLDDMVQKMRTEFDAKITPIKNDPTKKAMLNRLFDLAQSQGAQISQSHLDYNYIANHPQEMEAVFDFLEGFSFPPENGVMDYSSDYLYLKGYRNNQPVNEVIGNYQGKEYQYDGKTINPAIFREIVRRLNEKRGVLTKPIQQ